MGGRSGKKEGRTTDPSHFVSLSPANSGVQCNVYQGTLVERHRLLISFFTDQQRRQTYQ